ncbi:peptidylprolyl isomerase [Moorena sp. SIO3H5]|uniref:peptidylprolyl isomerase n=1 Tax=Moorena sp. SIO3H5 TaxID=2607834 RepID=UPI0025E3B502|nr:peptidylprolyl isomerase [Moorena sp. SIO3H5]
MSTKLVELIKTTKNSPRLLLDYKTKIIFYQFDEGETSFYEIAHEYIQDTELRRSGGYRGIVKRHEFKPEISAAVFAAEPPQLLKPIVSSKGVHLILVEEIVKSELDGKLRSEIMSDLFSGWLKGEIGEVEVVKELEGSSLSSN